MELNAMQLQIFPQREREGVHARDALCFEPSVRSG
jgi:hypothetical protein